MTEPTITVRRIYDPPDTDGYRVLVDRIWPRGISKEKAALDEWCREVAPSTELRHWYGHAPERYDEFRARYQAELDDPERAAAVADLRRHAPLTLLTATRELDLSHAPILAERLRQN